MNEPQLLMHIHTAGFIIHWLKEVELKISPCFCLNWDDPPLHVLHLQKVLPLVKQAPDALLN